MKTILFLLSLYGPLLAYGQEQTGHGRQHQQQQQQRFPFFKRAVIEGKEAEWLFKNYEDSSKKEDLSKKCSEPVTAIHFLQRHHRKETVCFDRGEYFWTDRYKCYGYKGASFIHFGPPFFNWIHNSCGGDGIYPIE